MPQNYLPKQGRLAFTHRFLKIVPEDDNYPAFKVVLCWGRENSSNFRKYPILERLGECLQEANVLELSNLPVAVAGTQGGHQEYLP